MQTIFSIGDVVDDESKGYTGKIVEIDVSEDMVFYTLDCYSEFPPEIAAKGHPDDRYKVIESRWIKPKAADAARVAIDRDAWEMAVKKLVRATKQAANGNPYHGFIRAGEELDALVAPFLAPSTSEENDHGAE